MLPADHSAAQGQPPDWALEQASEDLYDESDPEVIAARARDIAREVRARDDERHDEFDDPDEGGEA
jgi:hypothetical protein